MEAARPVRRAGRRNPPRRKTGRALRSDPYTEHRTAWIQLVVATPRSRRYMLAYGKRQLEVRAYRGQIPSPGRPTVAWREDRVRFWAAIARGVMTEDAAAEAGVSSPVGFRWFRHAGGVNPRLSRAVSGRYLPSSEREDIASCRAGCRRARDRAPLSGRVTTFHDPNTVLLMTPSSRGQRMDRES